MPGLSQPILRWRLGGCGLWGVLEEVNHVRHCLLEAPRGHEAKASQVINHQLGSPNLDINLDQVLVLPEIQGCGGPSHAVCESNS